MPEPSPNRRDFLTGRAVLGAAERAGYRLADDLTEQSVPSRGPTLMLRTTAMACDFDVMLNPQDRHLLDATSEALDLVHKLESQLSVYRPDSELSALNRRAFGETVELEQNLFDLLVRGQQLSHLTEGAFDPATKPLIDLWRDCRQQARIPTADEVQQALACSGVNHVRFNATEKTISFDQSGVGFNLGAIGKGYAVDRAGQVLLDRGVQNWLIHGGRSSVLAHGVHGTSDAGEIAANCGGWPIGLRNPLLPDKPFATLVLKDAALATSGTAVQWFRHEGKRYGHILDPRTGWPVETMLSVSVIAPDSAMADALSTAFFVLGVEKSLTCCDNLPESVRAIFFPLPKQGQILDPILHNVPTEIWFPAATSG
jgi:thiamine biosynthesis lipoprotein